MLVVAIRTAYSWRALFAIPAAIIGVFAGSWSGRKLRPWIAAFDDVWKTLKSLGAPLGSFVIGYAMIVLFFAEVFAAIWRLQPYAFGKELMNPRFGDFLYFSVVTAATLGYGDIKPVNGLARSAACIEVVIGIGWITIVFAAVQTLFQKRLAEKPPS